MSPSSHASFYLKRNIYFFLTALVIVLAGVYAYLQFQTMQELKTALRDNRETIESVQAALDVSTAAYQDAQANLADERLQFSQNVLTILPSGEELTNLTRFLDNFFSEHHRRSSPLIAENIQFGNVVAVEDGDYFVLPFTMGVESSIENFFRFLQFIEESGSLQNGVRLLEAESIQLNFDDAQTASDDSIRFTIHLNAYHRS